MTVTAAEVAVGEEEEAGSGRELFCVLLRSKDHRVAYAALLLVTCASIAVLIILVTTSHRSDPS